MDGFGTAGNGTQGVVAPPPHPSTLPPASVPKGAAPPPSPTHPLYTGPLVHPPTCDRCSLRASYSWEPLATPSHMA